MRIGIVCPYSLDVPGGVQLHVRDLAEALIALGHRVSVLAPAGDDAELPDYVVAAGKSMAVPYNGSVARLNFGPRAVARVRRWLHKGEFDVLHVHEPMAPSISLLAVIGYDGPDRGDLSHRDDPLARHDGRAPAGSAGA
jgi:phosphatidylinositol alpha-mannosyltransferase